jgi:hypothetical protein
LNEARERRRARSHDVNHNVTHRVPPRPGSSRSAPRRERGRESSPSQPTHAAIVSACEACRQPVSDGVGRPWTERYDGNGIPHPIHDDCYSRNRLLDRHWS